MRIVVGVAVGAGRESKREKGGERRRESEGKRERDDLITDPPAPKKPNIYGSED